MPKLLDIAKKYSIELIVLLYLLIISAFVSSAEEQKKCEAVKVQFNNIDDFQFVERSDVLGLISQANGPAVGKLIDKVNLQLLEDRIEQHASVADAEVYRATNGVLWVSVSQRNPVLRLIDVNGKGFYIDTEGRLMPLSKRHPARILVANGEFVSPVLPQSGSRVDTLVNKYGEKTVLNDLYLIANFVNQDEYWTSMIEQVYVDENQEYILVPKIGPRMVYLGNASNYEEKFAKLKIFYDKGLKVKGWDNYRAIKLQFKNQVVCVK